MVEAHAEGRQVRVLLRAQRGDREAPDRFVVVRCTIVRVRCAIGGGKVMDVVAR